MRVDKLSIKNFRNFRNFEIELQDFSLIIGENNIGKSNLLYSLALIFSSEISFTAKRNLRVDDINYASVRAFKSQIVENIPNDEIVFPEVRIEVTLSNFNEDQEAVVGDWFTGEWVAEMSRNKAKITYLYSKREDLNKWLNGQKEILNGLIKEDSETTESFFERKMSFIDFPIEYYSYFIFGGDDSTKSIDYRLMRYLKFELLNALRDPEVDLLASGNNSILFKVLYFQTENKLKAVKQQLLNLKDVIKGNTELKELKKEIELYLESISLIGDDTKIDFDFSQMEAVEMLKKISMIYGSDPIPISRNGLGRNNLLYISLLLSHLLKKSDTKNQVSFRLIGIEEPEVHLHPHLQENLAKKIVLGVRDYVQIIATSHSTHITSKLPLDNTIVLFRDNDEVKPYYLFRKIPPKSKVYLQKYLDATKATMFYAKKIILVEGISELLLLPKFFEIYTKNSLEQYGCNIVNVSGVAFKHFLETIKAGFFIKCVVITDSDSNKSKRIAERAYKLKSRYSSNKILIKYTSETLSTFEKEIIDANKDGNGKDLLFEALIATRPIRGKQLKRVLGSNPIDVEKFYSEIDVRDNEGNKQDDYKSEFAINLLNSLNKRDESSFTIPSYIKEAFAFILE